MDNNINNIIADDLWRVNALIRDTLSSDVQLLNTINNYLFNLKGKQLRPVLSLLSAMACGKVTPLTISCAAVAEMIHTATLLHDDVADNSAQRRGAPTIHKVYSAAASVLSGDYWLAKALSLLVKENDPRVMGFYTKAVEELSEGELFQIQKASTLDTTEGDYFYIIARKTSSLFVAAVGSAVYASGAGDDEIEQLSRYAYHLGIVFQIRDDIFDYMPELNTGKNAGTDIREKKITLPLIWALKNTSPAEREKMLELIRKTADTDNSLAEKTLEFVKFNSGIELARNSLLEHSNLAIESLSQIRYSNYKKELENLAVYAGTRDR